MAKLVKQFRLFIATPSDTAEEREIISQVVNEWNINLGQNENSHIETTHWTTHSYPEYGDRAQAIINKQIVEDADIIVGVFWTRFGTPTGEANSGTEEEIRLGIRTKKKVMVYFSEQPVSLNKVNFEEYNKIIQFKEEYKESGLYFSYLTTNEFRHMLRAHLSRIMQDLLKVGQHNENGHISMTFSEEYWTIILSTISHTSKLALEKMRELRDLGVKEEDIGEVERRTLTAPLIIQGKIVDELHKIGVITDHGAEKVGFQNMMKKLSELRS